MLKAVLVCYQIPGGMTLQTHLNVLARQSCMTGRGVLNNILKTLFFVFKATFTAKLINLLKVIPIAIKLYVLA